jgi:hypothetical protein
MLANVSKIITNTGTSRSINGETFANLFIIDRFDETNRIIKIIMLKLFRPSA